MSAQELRPDTTAREGASVETERSGAHSGPGAAASGSSLPVADPAPRAAVMLPATLPPGAAALPGRAQVLSRVQAAGSQVLPQLQYWVARLGIAGQAGLAALAAAAAVGAMALMPAQRAVQSLNAELVRAQHPASTARIEQAAPRLVASLPSRAQMPGVIGEMVKQAKAAGVPIDSGRYRYIPAKRGTIDSYEVEFPVKAAYPAIRTFIDGTLTALPAAALNKLHLERRAIGEQVVSADVGFVVFVRAEQRP